MDRGVVHMTSTTGEDLLSVDVCRRKKSPFSFASLATGRLSLFQWLVAYHVHEDFTSDYGGGEVQRGAWWWLVEGRREFRWVERGVRSGSDQNMCV